MKTLDAIWRFFTGASIASPLCVAAAIAFALGSAAVPAAARVGIFVTILVAALVLATFERER